MGKTILRILWGVVGAVLIAVGILSLCFPGAAVETMAVVFGIALLISGIVDIIIFAKGSKYLFGVGWFLVDGILTIILSLFLLFNVGFTALSLPYIFGMWLIFSGINRLVNSFDLKRFGVRGWGWMTALGIIAAVLGFISFLDPVLSALGMAVIVGILLIVQGVVAIVQAIFSGRLLK